MFERLTQGFSTARERLAGVRELDAENIAEALRDVRASLLEADVDYAVVKDFLTRVEERALGEKIKTRATDAAGRSLRTTPGQHFVAICERELAELMGPVDASLARGAQKEISVMLVGLQGVGKTTAAAKLARHLARQGRRPLLVAADVYRPAAVQQLEQLAARIEVPVHKGEAGTPPPEICAAALALAKTRGYDAIIYDTAGRLAIDENLMRELAEIRERVKPANTLLVCDALMGRDAVNVAKTFSEQITLDGVLLTKIDGDARGGAALAIKAVTGVPIKFLSTGESLERLEAFRPEGLASRILGMGDVVGLVEDFEAAVDEEEAAQAEANAARLLKGRFTLEDMLTQLKLVQRMGSLKDLLGKLPGFGSFANQIEGSELKKVESMIFSMTPGERQRPEVIDKSRASRIARGSGHNTSEVRNLVKRFNQMRDMFAGFGKGGGLLGKIPGFGSLAGAGGADPRALLQANTPQSGGAPRPVSAEKRNQQKRKRKQARKDRKRGRRR